MTDIRQIPWNGTTGAGNRDIGFAIGIVAILVVLFLPIPPILLDMGLAISISLSVVILMVALWIQRPLDFSAFPTVLLIATMLRLSLNVATTRLILSHGHALRDIMAITRVGGIGSEYAVDKPLLGRLSLALGENAELLKLHIGAVSEISDVIIDNLKRVDSDGTYSRCL